MLELARKLGILREPDPGATPEILGTTLLTITDGWVVTALGVFAVYLAVAAFAYALWAEHREEDSLYLSVGFICAGMTVFLLHQLAGAVVAVVATAFILSMQRRSA